MEGLFVCIINGLVLGVYWLHMHRESHSSVARSRSVRYDSGITSYVLSLRTVYWDSVCTCVYITIDVLIKSILLSSPLIYVTLPMFCTPISFDASYAP